MISNYGRMKSLERCIISAYGGKLNLPDRIKSFVPSGISTNMYKKISIMFVANFHWKEKRLESLLLAWFIAILLKNLIWMIINS